MSFVRAVVSRIKGLVVKGLIKAVNDVTDIQVVKASTQYDEITDDIERVQNYGFSSNPPIDSESIVIYFGGNKDHGVVIACDSGSFRVKGLLSGEAVFYAQFGQELKHNADGTTSLTNTGGFDVGTNTEPVAIASKVLALQNALFLVCNSFSPTGAPDSGLALAKVIAGALSNVTDFASVNLRANG